MKPAHKSTTAGQIVNQDKTIKVLSDYIKAATALETQHPFDMWLDEDYVDLNGQIFSRRGLWEPSEIEAARKAWEACEKTLSSKA